MTELEKTLIYICLELHKMAENREYWYQRYEEKRKECTELEEKLAELSQRLNDVGREQA